MGRTGAKKHIHQYFKMDNGLWGCALSDCTHFMPENVSNQVKGKLSLCHGCKEPFILEEVNMKQKQPKCENCVLKETLTEDDFGSMAEYLEYVKKMEKK